MPDLSFEVESAQSVTFAAAPLLALKLRIANNDEAELIHAVALRCQVRIEVMRHHYVGQEHERLLDLFGERERWSQTLRSLLWTHTSVVVPPFSGSTLVDMPLPCTYDFNVASAKYFYALEGGEVPISLLFSGTVFYQSGEDALQVAQIPWDREATYKMPVKVWKDMMAHYYPNSITLSLHQDAFDRLYRYKMQNGIPTWEQALERLLAGVEEVKIVE